MVKRLKDLWDQVFPLLIVLLLVGTCGYGIWTDPRIRPVPWCMDKLESGQEEWWYSSREDGQGYVTFDEACGDVLPDSVIDAYRSRR